jgi:hypothetical protein
MSQRFLGPEYSDPAQIRRELTAAVFNCVTGQAISLGFKQRFAGGWIARGAGGRALRDYRQQVHETGARNS